MPKTKTNIEEACDYALAYKWEGNRAYGHVRGTLNLLTTFFASRGITDLDAIGKKELREFVRDQEGKGIKGSTIKWRLAMLRGVVAEAKEASPPLATRDIPRFAVRVDNAPKWWLTPEAHGRLTAHLRKRRDPVAHLMADYVDFVCLHSGMRVEEALRLDRSCFRDLDGRSPMMWVPGTKTSSAARCLPLSEEAALFVKRRFEASDAKRLFEANYQTLCRYWRLVCKPFLDPEGEHPTATLKSLRRTYGAYKSAAGTPTEVLQKLYRHSDIATTVGYLNLIGGADAEALRRWV